MDHHKVLLALTSHEKEEGPNFEQKLEQIILKVSSLLPETTRNELTNDKTIEYNEHSVRFRYLKMILCVLKSLKDNELSSSDTFLSVNDYKIVRAAVEMAVQIGIFPGLIPGVGAGLSKFSAKAEKLEEEKLTELQKYGRLSLTVRELVNCFAEVAFRPALLPQLGPIIAALLQLSHAPLMKPSKIDSNSNNKSSSNFIMTTELYEKLSQDQKEFQQILLRLMDDCPRSTVVKELMLILGIETAPNWLRRRSRIYLIDSIIKPNGIIALVDALCNDTIDVGVHWNKLDTVSKLVALSHGEDREKYYDAVCSQIVDLLRTNIKNSSTIANSCIKAIYDYDKKVCIQKIFHVISRPLRKDYNDKPLARTETEVADCIDSLTKIFIPTDANFKHIDNSLLREVSMPLFNLHTKARQSVSLIKTKVKDLLINLLKDSESRKIFFAASLGNYDGSENLGERLSFRFGPTGGLEVTGEIENLDHEVAADSLFDLISNDNKLALDLFNYLLRSFSRLNKIKSHDTTTPVLENSEDTFDRIKKRMASMKLLANLAETRTIQEALVKKPEPLLDFVKNLFNERTDDQENVEVLYVSLMLVKIILTDNKKPEDFSGFMELKDFLKGVKKQGEKLPETLLALVEQILDIIECPGKSTTRRFYDLNMDGPKKESDFERALRDLTDPLLPVRAHGLMSLTKLIEIGDFETVEKKDIILCFFQENLKNEDSFIYLAAVNGLCALASRFPQKVIETLVQEYIDMPQRNKNGDISPETRAKLGEILVKTTRSLGDMAPAYKSILINGFLCGTRDSDDLVRASSLSCLGELCKVLGFRLGNAITEVIYCIGCIIATEKSSECRRAAVLVANLLIRGLGRDALTDLGSDLVPFYRALKSLRDNDDDQVLRIHAQLALEELDDIVKILLFTAPPLEKRIFLLP